MNSSNFFSELKRRNVYKVAVAYAVVSWLLIQIATQVFPFFEIPNWAVQLVVLLLILGFPAALILSWAFEITPEGIKRDKNVAPNEFIARRTGRKIVAITAVLAVIAAGMFVFRFVRSNPVMTNVPSPVSTAPAAPAAVLEKSIAVLPFENLSDDKQNTYFADGVQDQILTNLAKVSDLKVISHTSVRQYGTGIHRNIREIGQQLGVAYILEGSVQRSGDRLRINAELIDARTDAHTWAETYDRTAADLFAMQSELAQSIVTQLKGKLSPQQKAEMEERPTQDLVAFELYLQAKQIIDSYVNAEDVRAALVKALQSLDQAIKRDENFVSAYCYVARANDLVSRSPSSAFGEPRLCFTAPATQDRYARFSPKRQTWTWPAGRPLRESCLL